MRVARAKVAPILIGIVLGLTLAGCDPIDLQPPASGAQGDGAGTTSADLGALRVAGWASMSGYSRDRFPHWNSQGGGCDTRDVVLKRSGDGVLTTEDCKIIQGTWYSVYDGKTIADPQELDVDHMVPLANAWRTGAKEWTDAKRSEFANDLNSPQLVAVTASSNRSKGDQDPSQWKPPRQEYWCEYAKSWVAVKAKWALSVTADEKATLSQMLARCG